MREKAPKPKKERTEEPVGKLGAGRIVGRVLTIVLTTVLAVVLALVVIVASIIHGPSESARDTFVTTVLESGNLKFLATMFLSEDEINEIVSRTSMGEMETNIDEGMIATDTPVEGNFDEHGVEIVQVNGRSFFGTLMIVADPSQVFVGTTYPWGEYGKELGQLCDMHQAVGGVNGGLYAADMNKGGRPYGVCVSNGEILLNDPSGWTGLYMIGLDSKNILRIESISGWTPNQFKSFVEEQGIRDAVAFQDEASDSNNHFVPLIINGEARQLNGAGSGANPRTVIGQRADGAILLLVTDGRGASGHLGATAQDLINVMQQYGAVNAANLDGGSSSSLYYDGEYLMTSVTLYYANSSWRLPTSFLVKSAAGEGGN
ncbi:MAG: phosphodiester glycosidase family protein [Firmicutes bacterium]|nr:phosphodiester glycosidase family protein [Bacillota bacterium]